MLRLSLMIGAASAVMLAGCTQTELFAQAEPVIVETASEVASADAEAVEESTRVTMGNLVMENIPEIPASVGERLRQYQNVRGHGFSDWADEGILIGTRFGETSQVHHVKTPGGARQQVTFYNEPVGGGNVRLAYLALSLC